MAAPPRFGRFFAEDYADAPEWFKRFLGVQSELLLGTTSALTGRLTRSENMLSRVEPFDFTTQATAANGFPLKFKNKLGVKPTVAFVGQLYKQSGAAISAAWSMSWVTNSKNELEVTFQGLENSTRYLGVLVYEG